VDDAELARLEHENFVYSTWLVARLQPPGLVRREDGIALLASGLPMRLFNQVLVESDAAEESAMADAVGRMRLGGFRFVVHLRDAVDDRFVPLMASLGLVGDDRADLMPGMVLHPITDGAPTPEELTIRQVDATTGFDDHVRVAAAGFGLDEEAIRAFLDVRLLEVPGCRLYVGYVDGQPVACAAGLPLGRTIGVYNVATLERARGRGYGTAMTARVARDGQAAGCAVAALQASAMGRPVYERLGYRTVVRYRAFVEPEPDSP
jgi:GNAT superfamily N-acetyltransferase